jgi:membrane protein DedA with SNARE-associated domain/rhodanese-related sulfurtransferase
MNVNEAIQFLVQHGALILFAIVFAEQVGLPVPAIPLLIAAGAVVGTGQMSLWSVVGASLIAALLGDLVWYLLGRLRGRQVLGLLCRIALEPDACVRRTEDFFARHGARSLIVAKFFPGLSTIAPPMAGIVGMSVPLFLIYDGVGTLLWAGVGIAAGYVFSDQIEEAAAYAVQIGPTFGFTVIGSLVAYVVYKALYRRRLFRQIPRITVVELLEMLAAGKEPVIVDLRQLGDEGLGIPGAVRMTVDELRRRYQELPRDRDIILYCACPRDAASAGAALLLQEKGLTRVWPLAGGIDAWHAHYESFAVVNRPSMATREVAAG